MVSISSRLGISNPAFGAECITPPGACWIAVGDGRERRGNAGTASTVLLAHARESDMSDLGEEAAVLAAILARSVGHGGAVCLGCSVAGLSVSPARWTLITLSLPPPREVRIELERLLLLISLAPRASRPDLRACAAAGVPEVWLFEEREGTFESLSLPRAGRYRRRSLILPGERVALAALPQVELVPLLP